MKRRAFLAALGAAAGWSVVARAQQPAMPVIGHLTSSTLSDFWPPFSQGLNSTGFVEGKASGHVHCSARY
jgi:putative tryptophan/tyrosine transport system substrate-binding protein